MNRIQSALGGIFLLLILFQNQSFGQTAFDDSYFLDARIFVDTLEFSWKNNTITQQQRKQLAFKYSQENEVAEVYLFFDMDAEISKINLIPSGDFYLMDSMMFFSDYARFKVRFNQLTKSNFLRFTFKVTKDSVDELVDLPLFPYTETYVDLYPATDELYIGEEKEFELTTNNADNIVADNRWSEGLPINYRITRDGSKLMLHLLPNALGDQMISIPFQLEKPYFEFGKPKYQLPLLNYSFKIRSGRLAFLQFDRQEVTPNDDKTEAIEIQIDNNRQLRIGKTYRIENQEESGGALIAELYTKARLNNDRVLCLLRPYAFHRKSEGYLYIKDGDDARFVSNLDITPKTKITAIYIQREGKDWEKTSMVHPGESINVRLEGEGLHKANFSFPGASNLEYDSLVKNEEISLFSLKVPMTIGTKNIEIFNHNKSTGTALRVEEYLRPRPFDFITLDFGDKQYLLDDIDKPIYYETTITDLVFNLDQNKIDEGRELYGPQYLTIKVKISDKQGKLIELYQFDEVVVCPGETSPRYLHYDSKKCRLEDINLNNFIAKKTSELDEWSRIDLEFSHIKSKYGGEGRIKKVQIYLKRQYNYDIDVSFPAGLLIVEKGTSKPVTNFGGASFAMLAQMSFYQPGRIAKYLPYKIGAGFIAINAFNVSSKSTNQQDIGLVVLGSLYPTSSNNKLTFPLYAGFGYKMSAGKPFFLLGPGIRVRF